MPQIQSLRKHLHSQNLYAKSLKRFQLVFLEACADVVALHCRTLQYRPFSKNANPCNMGLTCIQPLTYSCIDVASSVELQVIDDILDIDNGGFNNGNVIGC